VVEKVGDSGEGRQTDARERSWSRLRGGNARRCETRRASRWRTIGRRTGGILDEGERETERERERERENKNEYRLTRV